MNACLALLACGCGDRSATPAAGGGGEPIHVLATTYAMADIVRTVGGERVRVEWWVESGQSIAELADNPQRRQQLNSVDLIVTRGQVDPWTLGGVGNAYQDQRVLRIDTLTPAQDFDPAHFIWLDPLVARDLAEELANRLGTLDPLHQADFRANADAFKKDVVSQWEAMVIAVNRAGGGPFVTLDRGFLPLAKRFGLEEVRVPSVDLREPTAFNVKQIRDATRQAGGGAVFANAESPAALLREWEVRLSMPVLSLDPLGTSARSGHSTYLQLLRYNLEQLQKGLALSKPRERAAPGAIGAVLDSRPDDLPVPDDGDEDPATTRPTTAAAAAAPAATPPPKPFFPQPMSQYERVPLNIPKPTPTSQPRSVPSPFRPIPTK